RIRRRDGVWARAVHVETQDLSAQVRERLAGPEGIAASAAITDRGIKITVRAERDLAAVVVALLRMGNHDHDRARSRIGEVRISRGAVVALHDDFAAVRIARELPRVEDEEA